MKYMLSVRSILILRSSFLSLFLTRSNSGQILHVVISAISFILKQQGLFVSQQEYYRFSHLLYVYYPDTPSGNSKYIRNDFYIFCANISAALRPSILIVLNLCNRLVLLWIWAVPLTVSGISGWKCWVTNSIESGLTVQLCGLVSFFVLVAASLLRVKPFYTGGKAPLQVKKKLYIGGNASILAIKPP